MGLDGSQSTIFYVRTTYILCPLPPIYLFGPFLGSLVPWYLVSLLGKALEKSWKSLGKNKYQGILIDRIDSFVSPGTACVIIDVNLSLNCTPGDR